MSEPTLGFISLGVVFVAILTGFPMAFSFIFVALIFGYIGIHGGIFYLLTYQFFGLMLNTTLAAVPLFLFMGYILEQSGMMERMFRALQMLLASLRGSLYMIVLIIATVFAAATGIVGASVTIMGVMAAPIMKANNYNVRLSAGAIGAGGTLGILIPPSIMLIVMGPVVGVPVSDLFTAAIIPGLLLSCTYIGYTLIRSLLNPSLGPPLPAEVASASSSVEKIMELVIGVLPVTIVIGATLGLIIFGVTTPTDAAATGSFASLVLALFYRRLSWSQFKHCVLKTMETTAFIMFLILSANFFGATFARLGSADVLTDMLLHMPLPGLAMLGIMLGIILLLGAPLEWIPIVLVVMPMFLPTVEQLGFNLLWFSVLVAVTLQTSWLTPPMALAAFFLKGVVPDWSMRDIYAGMAQFVVLQVLVVILLIFFPVLILWLPSLLH